MTAPVVDVRRAETSVHTRLPWLEGGAVLVLRVPDGAEVLIWETA